MSRPTSLGSGNSNASSSSIYQSSRHDVVVLQRLREILMEEPCSGIPTAPARLLPHVFIGNQRNASSLRLLQSLKITHVLNCAGFKGPRTQPNVSPYEGLGIDYHEFKAEDVDTYDIRRHFPEAFSFLDHVKKVGGVCLVHCAMGINRSGATCLAYMMAHEKSPLLRTTKIVKKKRRIVLTNRGFQRQLIAWARTKGLLEKNIEEAVPGPVDPLVQMEMRRAVGGGHHGIGCARDLPIGNGKSSSLTAIELMTDSFLNRSRELRRLNF